MNIKFYPDNALSLFPTSITIVPVKYRVSASIFDQMNVLDSLLEANYVSSIKLTSNVSQNLGKEEKNDPLVVHLSSNFSQHKTLLTTTESILKICLATMSELKIRNSRL